MAEVIMAAIVSGSILIGSCALITKKIEQCKLFNCIECHQKVSSNSPKSPTEDIVKIIKDVNEIREHASQMKELVEIK